VVEGRIVKRVKVAGREGLLVFDVKDE